MFNPRPFSAVEPTDPFFRATPVDLFTCTHCGQVLYFENNTCEKCRYPLGFESTRRELLPLVPDPTGSGPPYRLYGEPADAPRYAYCHNHQHQVCNWLVPAGSDTPFCAACDLNRTIPDLGQPGYLGRWQHLEAAKHRLVYELLCLHLPVVSKRVYPDEGLQFDFKADEDPQHKVMTGHDNGLITINIAEADAIEREQARQAMHELYRTLLGHFRHEVGHYYWDRLVAGSPYLDEYRQLFGDERQDYAQALQRHYQQGAPPDWQQHYISAYATSHPWEDWAETWAHYLHILDTLQTGAAFGLRLDPLDAGRRAGWQATLQNPFEVADFGKIMDMWLPLTFALNSLNRSMGLPDPYPFVISPEVGRKLAFIHQVAGGRGGLGRG